MLLLVTITCWRPEAQGAVSHTSVPEPGFAPWLQGMACRILRRAMAYRDKKGGWPCSLMFSNYHLGNYEVLLLQARDLAHPVSHHCNQSEMIQTLRNAEERDRLSLSLHSNFTITKPLNSLEQDCWAEIASRSFIGLGFRTGIKQKE